ncbi:MAG: tail fiber domain-containing protein [Flavobacteriales bacterium]|nr:tail fiber domain-containing protein [Flavobacteriales bacterium]
MKDMKTLSIRLQSAALISLLGATAAKGQFNTGGGGQQYLTNPSDGVNIGFGIAAPSANLTVNGWDLTSQTTNQFDTYGTFTAAGSIENETRWRLHRVSDANGTPREIGRLYALAGTVGALNNGFHIRQMEQNAALWLRNFSNNGIRLIDDVTTTVNGYTNLNVRAGYVGIGQIVNPAGGTNLMSTIGAPWSRVHLVHPSTPDAPQGWRPHMRNGTVMSGNGDLAYFGQMFDMGANGTGAEVVGNSNALIGWGSADLPVGSHAWDNCSFRFGTDPAGGITGSASSVRGLELMRLRPFRSAANAPLEGFVGLGDWAAGADIPQERLDILDGRVRIRTLPDAANQADGIYKVMVVDDAASGNERGVVKWVDPSSFTGADCDWTIENDGTSGGAVSHNVYTAVNASDDCPDDDDAVGIGVDLAVNAAPAKLALSTAVFNAAMDVQQSSTGSSSVGAQLNVAGATSATTGVNIAVSQGTDTGADNRGVYINAIGSGLTNNNWNYGLRADLSQSSYRTRGVSAFTSGARYTGYAGWFVADDDAQWTSGVAAFGRVGTIRRGVEGHAQGDGELQVGVHGFSSLAPATWTLPNAKYVGVAGQIQKQDVEGERFFAVYGHTEEVDADTWAGYFDGHVHITGDASCTAMAWTSDEALKTDVEDLTQGLEIISELRPTTYHFDTDTYAEMNLPAGNQFGFIAQEVEEVLPELVGQTTFIGRIDSLGNVIAPDQTVKTLNYVGLIPILVAGMQEQQAQIAAQNATIAAMQQQLAACCASPTDSDQRSGSAVDDEKLTPAQERTLPAEGTVLRIAPNPFTDGTTLFCTLERAGRMQLLANSADGRSLLVLSEGQREAGEFQYDWTTENLAPGVYYITLLLDGEPVVKRAVKVGR